MCDLAAIEAKHAAAARQQGCTATQLLNTPCACKPLDIFMWTSHAFENLRQDRTPTLTLIRHNFVHLVVGLATRREIHARVQRITKAI